MLKVREVCKQKGVTLQEVANRLGITYQSLYDSLNGNPTLNRLKSIAEVLGVEVVDLFATASVPPAEGVLTCPHCGKGIAIKAEAVQ